jgi:hypothetical protein
MRLLGARRPVHRRTEAPQQVQEPALAAPDDDLHPVFLDRPTTARATLPVSLTAPRTSAEADTPTYVVVAKAAAELAWEERSAGRRWPAGAAAVAAAPAETAPT